MMPLLSRLYLKKSRQYNVVSKNLMVIRVELLDGTPVECTLFSESSGQECLDNVCQRFGIKQPEFFGLKYRSRRQPPQRRWLDLERPLKKQLDRHAESSYLQFGVMFYVPDVNILHDEMTRTQYFLQLKCDVLDGKLHANYEQAVMLASYSLQAELGDFEPGRHSLQYLTEFSIFPKHMTEDGDRKETLCDAALQAHSALRGLSHQLAEVYYIMEVQQLEGYGQEHFLCRNDLGDDVLVGASLTGIVVRAGGSAPASFYRWLDITNLHNHKRSFGIELTESRTVQFSMGDKEFAKYVWKTCVQQHKFYQTNRSMLDEAGTISELPIPDIQATVRVAASRSGAAVTGGLPPPALSPPGVATSVNAAPHSQLPGSTVTDGVPTAMSGRFSGAALADTCATTVYPIQQHSTPFPAAQNQQHPVQHQHHQPAAADHELQRSQLLPKYRAAPDYETAVQRVYGGGDPVTTNTGQLLSIPSHSIHQIHQPQQYLSQPDIHNSTIQTVATSNGGDYSRYGDYADLSQWSPLGVASDGGDSGGVANGRMVTTVPVLDGNGDLVAASVLTYSTPELAWRSSLGDVTAYSHHQQWNPPAAVVPSQQLMMMPSAQLVTVGGGQLPPPPPYPYPNGKPLSNSYSTPNLSASPKKTTEGSPDLVSRKNLLNHRDAIATIATPQDLHRTLENLAETTAFSQAPSCEELDLVYRVSAPPSVAVIATSDTAVVPPAPVSITTTAEVHHPPVEVHHPPVDVHHPPVEVHHPPVEVHHPPVEVHHPLVEVHLPSVEVHHPPVEVHHPPVEVHHPPVEVHHPPVEVHHPPVDHPQEDGVVSSAKEPIYVNLPRLSASAEVSEAEGGGSGDELPASADVVAAGGGEETRSCWSRTAPAAEVGVHGPPSWSQRTPAAPQSRELTLSVVPARSPSPPVVQLPSGKATSRWQQLLTSGSTSASASSSADGGVCSGSSTLRRLKDTFQRHRDGGDSTGSSGNGGTREAAASGTVSTASASPPTSAAVTPANVVVRRASTAIPRHQRREALEARLRDPSFFREFETVIKRRESAEFSTGERPDNLDRNRFKDVLPYEDNRVRVTPSKHNPSGYINASHMSVTMGSQQRFYMAAQGPLAGTVVDFWRAVWENRVQLIVMLTDDDAAAVGNGQPAASASPGADRSFPYWPREDGASCQFGEFVVRRRASTRSSSYTTSQLTVARRSVDASALFFPMAAARRSKQPAPRVVWHLQYTGWPDRGCPADRTGFVELLQEMESLRLAVAAAPDCAGPGAAPADDPAPNAPVLVHCAAGVGRTGVTVMCHALLHCLDHNLEVDVPKLLRHMRQQRMLMVQTLAQYRFVYEVLIQYLQGSRLI